MIVTKSYIYNGFRGFAYGTVYELDDGSQWRIIDHRFRLGSTLRPLATVTKSGNKFRLRVQGIKGSVSVEPLRAPTVATHSDRAPTAYEQAEYQFDKMLYAALNKAVRRPKRKRHDW